VYNLNYTSTTLGGVKLKINYIWGYANKTFEYHCPRELSLRKTMQQLHVRLSEDTKCNVQNITNKKNSVACVRERTIPTERPPIVGDVSANFCG
jgi:hypothetical protein